MCSRASPQGGLGLSCSGWGSLCSVGGWGGSFCEVEMARARMEVRSSRGRERRVGMVREVGRCIDEVTLVEVVS